MRWFRPLRRLRLGQVNHRTHRKVLIVDEAIAFTGGVGIADEWQGDARNEHEWRDTHFRIQGPAVDGLRAAFLDNWAETDPELFDEGRRPLPRPTQARHVVVQCVRGASETGWSDVATLFRTLLQLAEHRVRITTAYFVPDAELAERLCDAADRGVRGARSCCPAPTPTSASCRSPARRRTHALLEHGVELWNFQPSMLHAKVMTVDGVVANVGSANLNARSIDAATRRSTSSRSTPTLAGVLDAHFDDDLERSVRIEPGRWERRSLAAAGGRDGGPAGQAVILTSTGGTSSTAGSARSARLAARGSYRELRDGQTGQPEEGADEHVGRVMQAAVRSARSRR